MIFTHNINQALFLVGILLMLFVLPACGTSNVGLITTVPEIEIQPTSIEAKPTLTLCKEGEPIRLTNNDQIDGFPVWSPNSKWIAYFNDGYSQQKIFLFNPENGETILIAYDPGMPENSEDYEYSVFFNRALSWSPDGTKLMFSHEYSLDSNNPGVVILDVDEAIKTPYTPPRYSEFKPIANGIALDWSLDGKKILLLRQRALDDYWSKSLFAYDIDSQESYKITPSELTVLDGFWSPDGKQISFSTTQSEEKGEIFIVNSDGTNLVQLTHNDYYESDPVWSPDGRYIAFSSNRNGSWDIYALSLETREQYQLTGHPFQEATRSWSKDNYLAIWANWDGQYLDYFNNGIITTAEFEIYTQKVCLP